jgi:hypothetical protein
VTWTLLGEQIYEQGSTNPDIRQGIYYRVVSADEPANYTWTYSGGAQSAGGIVAFRNVRVPTAGNFLISNNSGGSGSTTATGASIAAVPTGSTLVAFFGTFSNFQLAGGIPTQPANMAVQYDLQLPTAELTRIRAATQANVSGTTGTRTVSYSPERRFAAHMVALFALP